MSWRLTHLGLLAVAANLFVACVGFGMRARIKAPKGAAVHPVTEVLAADPTGHVDPDGAVAAVITGAAAAHYDGKLIPMPAIHALTEKSHAKALSAAADVLLARYQAAFVALRTEQEASQTGLGPKPPSPSAAGTPPPGLGPTEVKSFPGWLPILPASPLAAPLAAGGHANAGVDGFLDLAQRAESLGDQLINAATIVKKQDWGHYADWRQQAPKVASDLDDLAQVFLTHAGISHILLSDVSGSEFDYVAGTRIRVTLALIEPQDAAIRFYGVIEMQKTLIPIPFSVQLGRAVTGLLEAAAMSEKAAGKPLSL